MRVTFRLRFHTHYGQSLWLAAEWLTAEDWIALEYLDSECWQVRLEVAEEGIEDRELSYEYGLRESDGRMTRDWGRTRRINLAEFKGRELWIIDSWNAAGFWGNAFYTKAFQEVLLRQGARGEAHGGRSKGEGGASQSPQQRAASEDATTSPAPRTLNSELQTSILEQPRREGTHVFRVRAPLLAANETLCLLGSGSVLGNWGTERPLLMSRAGGGDWYESALDLTQASFPLAYKYGVFDVQAGRFVRFEAGQDRWLRQPADGGREAGTSDAERLVLVDDGFAVLPMDTWRGAGVAIPVFSLRSEGSFGIGEFADLKLLAEWAARAGLKLIQLLPVNDTTTDRSWRDSYPYSAISAFALHPIYVCLKKVVSEENAALLEEFEGERRRLNGLERVDYPAVMRLKEQILRRVYELEKERVMASEDYRLFYEENREWLEPYGKFCYLRDRYGTANFRLWPEDRRYDEEGVKRLAEMDAGAREGVEFYFFVQYHLDRQLHEAAEYAHGLGVVLKGDLAIGVSREGADVWEAPELFHVHLQAGAPPDAFAERGQNWGFPTYNWERMKEDGYRWWRRRLGQMSRYFDAFRVDHILGFFRIWSIPWEAVEGILGHFCPALPVRVEEFAERGIEFNPGRFLEPYITDDVLSTVFSGKTERVKEQFLESTAPGTYRMKPGFRTQVEVERWLREQPERNVHIDLRRGLFELISNVLLLPAEEQQPTANGKPAGGESKAFHFRFGIDRTSSFQALDERTRSRLWDLYVDYFYRRQEGFWRQEGLKKLPPLQRATSLLVCGEDLGMVPNCVPEVMRELGILGLEVQRMPKREGRSFSRPAEAGYLSVVTPSTHDMSTVRGWWREDRMLTQRFYNEELGKEGEAPAECEPWVCEAILEQHLRSPAMWSVFQWQDLLGLDGELRHREAEAERINVPSEPGHCWGYRMHLTLEALLGAERFNHHLAQLVRRSGR